MIVIQIKLIHWLMFKLIKKIKMLKIKKNLKLKKISKKFYSNIKIT
jgi:hypothetical protein